MKRFFLIATVLTCLVFLVINLVYAQEESAIIFEQLKAELQNEGMTLEDINVIEIPVRDMLARGSNKEELKKILLDLSSMGISGEELKNLVNSIDELVKNGELPKQAGSIVSQAAQQVKALGLKGEELKTKVQEAVTQKKIEQMKVKLQEQQNSLGGKVEEIKKKIGEEFQKQKEMMNNSISSFMKWFKGEGKDKN